MLGLFLLRNFFSAAGSIFSAFYSFYLDVQKQKPIQIHHNFAKLSLNFNFNFVESWDSFILNSSMPPNRQTTHPYFELVSEPPDILNKRAKILQENIDLAALKKFLSKNDPRKSSNSKSIISQINIFKQLKNKITNKSIFWTQK